MIFTHNLILNEQKIFYIKPSYKADYTEPNTNRQGAAGILVGYEDGSTIFHPDVDFNELSNDARQSRVLPYLINQQSETKNTTDNQPQNANQQNFNNQQEVQSNESTLEQSTLPQQNIQQPMQQPVQQIQMQNQMQNQFIQQNQPQNQPQPIDRSQF